PVVLDSRPTNNVGEGLWTILRGRTDVDHVGIVPDEGRAQAAPGTRASRLRGVVGEEVESEDEVVLRGWIQLHWCRAKDRNEEMTGVEAMRLGRERSGPSRSGGAPDTERARADGGAWVGRAAEHGGIAQPGEVIAPAGLEMPPGRKPRSGHPQVDRAGHRHRAILRFP